MKAMGEARLPARRREARFNDRSIFLGATPALACNNVELGSAALARFHALPAPQTPGRLQADTALGRLVLQNLPERNTGWCRGEQTSRGH